MSLNSPTRIHMSMNIYIGICSVSPSTPYIYHIYFDTIKINVIITQWADASNVIYLESNRVLVISYCFGSVVNLYRPFFGHAFTIPGGILVD